MAKKKSGEEPKGGGPGAKAKAQKLAALAEKEDAAHKKKEAQREKQWADGANERAEQRAKEAAAKEAAKEALKAAKKAQEAADEADIAAMRAPAGKARKAAAKKGTKKKNDLSMLDAYLAEAEKGKKGKAKASSGNDSEGIAVKDLLKPNMNRVRAEEAAKGNIDASGVDNALAALGLTEDAEGPKSKNRKALYMAFEEREMPRLREENPGLKRSQLKERIFKEWQKHPDNPDNQPDA